MRLVLLVLTVIITLMASTAPRDAGATTGDYMKLTEQLGSWGTGSYGLIFNLSLSNHEPPAQEGEYSGPMSISSVFIGAKGLVWDGGPNYVPSLSGNMPGTWSSMILKINADDKEWVVAYKVDSNGNYSYLDKPLLKGLGTGFLDYTWGYLFWDTSGQQSEKDRWSKNAILSGGQGSFYVEGGELGTPYAVTWYRLYAENPNSDPDPTLWPTVPPYGYGVNHTGEALTITTPSVVPVPGAILLFGPALIGLAAAKRRLGR